MADVGRMTRDEQYVLDARIFQTLEEHALAHHASGTEDHDLHERRLQRTQRQRAVTLSRQSKEGVDNRRRDRRDGRFTAPGWLVAARDDVHVDRGRGVLHVRRLKAVEVALFDPAILERDYALGHELTESEDHAALTLALNRQRIDGHAHDVSTEPDRSDAHSLTVFCQRIGGALAFG